MAAPTNIGYTDLAAVQRGGVNYLADLLDTNLTAGRVKLITAVYTMTGAEVANDAIYIARIPSGSLVNLVAGNVACNDISTNSGTLQIGDTDTWQDSQTGVATRAYNPARYSAALTILAGNSTVGFAFSGGTDLLAPTKINDDWVWLIATFATLQGPTAGKKIVFRIPVMMLD